MKGLLIRVGADQSEAGGLWNGPVDTATESFAYVPIPESYAVRPGLNTPYQALVPHVSKLGRSLPSSLATRNMHLDPDFDHLTYGDQGERAKQIRAKVNKGDLLVFYAGLESCQSPSCLVYAIIGLYVVDQIVDVNQVASKRWHENAHTRRIFSTTATDVVVRARPGVSGRMERCIPIGSYRERAYRVTDHLLQTWGGISVKNGYLQRSARLPELNDAERFYNWFLAQGIPLLPRNN